MTGSLEVLLIAVVMQAGLHVQAGMPSRRPFRTIVNGEKTPAGWENTLMKTKLFLKVLLGFTTIVSASHAEEIGSVDTKFKFLGPDHKIVIEAFDDPKIEGITCHLSRSKKGGLKGMIGVAEETSDASIACRQVGPIRVVGELTEGEKVFRESRSLIFKTLQVVRFFDKKRQTYIYLVYSDRVIDGSPQNAISTVPIQA